MCNTTYGLFLFLTSETKATPELRNTAKVAIVHDNNYYDQISLKGTLMQI